MKKFLKSKKGVTILEGLIALLLLAMVATGTFGVLLSISRRSSQPDIREEMVLAVERAMNKLQVYVYTTPESDAADEIKLANQPEAVKNGLCGGSNLPNDIRVVDTDPLSIESGTDSTHDIPCMLPPICDKNHSSFSYTVTKLTNDNHLGKTKLQTFDVGSAGALSYTAAIERPYEIQFNITCNGYKL